MAKRNSSNLDVTPNADGFTVGGGTTPRSLTVTGGNATITGGGSAVITFPSATGTLATLNLEENLPLKIDMVLSADGTYSGIAIDGTAGATLAFGDLCYLDTSIPNWELADASDATTSGTRILGMCVLASTDGNPTRMLVYGSIRADAVFPTFNAGQIYISETAGDVTNTAPSTTDAAVRVVGHAITGDSMFFNPSPDYITRT